MIKQQAAQLKLVEGLQKQMLDLQASTQLAPPVAQDEVQVPLLPSSSTNQVTQVESEQSQGEKQTPQVVMTKRRARQVTEVTTTKTINEVEEFEVKITSWDDQNPIQLTTEQMQHAFSFNPILREYASLRTPTDMIDPKKAPPYVLEVMMELIRRGHAEPESRNVRLNPVRADQVRVKTGETWEVRELVAAARFLLEAVSRAMKKATLSDEERQKLELDVQEAVVWAWQLYEESPSAYARAAQKPLAAHLVNMTPSPEK
jgi:hypothetical protein